MLKKIDGINGIFAWEILGGIKGHFCMGNIGLD
jgi:hypothetical protein